MFSSLHAFSILSYFPSFCAQIEELAIQRKLKIMGVYAGNELDSDGCELTAWPRLLGDKVAEQGATGAPLVFMVRHNHKTNVSRVG